jgi:ribosomal protein L40E
MKLQKLNCPACGRSVEAENLQTNQIFICPACHTSLVLTDLTVGDQIICPQCQTINHESERYCEGCGTALKQNCPFCYSTNPTTADHCQNCGANLARAKARKQSWLTKQRRHEAERRQALDKALAEERQNRLQKLLDDLDEPENHPMAIYGLHQFGAEAVDALIAHLNDDDPDARFGAAQTLGRIGDPKAIPGLIAALRDADPAVRYWAAEALGQLRAEAAVDALGELLNDKHKGVRHHAAVIIQKIGGARAEAVLRRQNKRWWQF